MELVEVTEQGPERCRTKDKASVLHCDGIDGRVGGAGLGEVQG